MFLKQGSFNYEKQSRGLDQLSGLQRIYHLAFVHSEPQSLMPGGRMPGGGTNTVLSLMGMDINPAMVSLTVESADEVSGMSRSRI